MTDPFTRTIYRSEVEAAFIQFDHNGGNQNLNRLGTFLDSFNGTIGGWREGAGLPRIVAMPATLVLEAFATGLTYNYMLSKGLNPTQALSVALANSAVSVGVGLAAPALAGRALSALGMRALGTAVGGGMVGGPVGLVLGAVIGAGTSFAWNSLAGDPFQNAMADSYNPSTIYIRKVMEWGNLLPDGWSAYAPVVVGKLYIGYQAQGLSEAASWAKVDQVIRRNFAIPSLGCPITQSNSMQQLGMR